MPVLFQITLGTILLLICTFLHLLITTNLIRRLKAHERTHEAFSRQGNFMLSGVVIAIFLISHTLHLYIWAFAILALGALPGFEDSIYFSLVTYSTVGYGDVTLDDDFRIFGAMASVTGILLFGVTTAFLVSFFARLLTDEERDE